MVSIDPVTACLQSREPQTLTFAYDDRDPVAERLGPGHMVRIALASGHVVDGVTTGEVNKAENFDEDGELVTTYSTTIRPVTIHRPSWFRRLVGKLRR